MKTQHTLILLFSAFLFLNLKCKKDNPPLAILPAATQEGKNTVGFTLNGEVWIPYAICRIGADPCGEISARYSTPLAAPNGIGFQFARFRNSKSSSLSIYTLGGGTITTIGDKIDSIGISFQDENWSGNSGAYNGTSGSKFLITKIDHQNQTISGEFEFVLRENNGSGKTIVLKDGRFDFKFNACKCSN